MKNTFRIICLLIVLFIILPVVVRAADPDLTEAEVMALADNLRAEIEFIKLYDNQAWSYYNLYIDGVDRWHKDAKPPEGSVIVDEGTGEVKYIPFAPFARINSSWNENGSPVQFYGKVSELKDRLSQFCDSDTAGWILYDRLKGQNPGGGYIPWLYTDDAGKEWMSQLQVYQQDAAMDRILFVEGLTVEGNDAKAVLYTGKFGDGYYRLTIQMRLTDSGWKITESEYLKFLTASGNEGGAFFEDNCVSSLPEAAGTGDEAYLIVGLLFASAACLFCAIASEKSLHRRKKVI
ncbi:MAG: hypothetical protein K5647_01620 [Clostridiales bacterium]|nr:hypothetical protein [Clostridiales bacterium]